MHRIDFKLYNPFSQFDNVKEIWTSLLEKCPHTYFLSWGWRELWLQSLPDDCKLSFVAGFVDDSPVTAFFIGSKTAIRHKFISVRQLSLNLTNDPLIDDAAHVEYNAILIDPKLSLSLESLLELIPIEWDEFQMCWCTPIYQPNLILNDKMNRNYSLSIKELKSYYVCLDKVRRNNNDYLSLLSKNRRKRIQRSLKEYEKMGELRIHLAENAEDGLIILDELIKLNQARWNKRGFLGHFSNNYFVDFHKDLISKRFEHREIQLARICAGDHTIGCLYNFVYEGKVFALTGGYNYLPENYYLPGYICDYLVILHSAKSGLSCYDFLEGESEYKRSLTTDHHDMQTILIQKKNLKFYMQRIIVGLSRRYRNIKELISSAKIPHVPVFVEFLNSEMYFTEYADSALALMFIAH